MPRPTRCPRCGSRLIAVRTFCDGGLVCATHDEISANHRCTALVVLVDAVADRDQRKEAAT